MGTAKKKRKNLTRGLRQAGALLLKEGAKEYVMAACQGGGRAHRICVSPDKDPNHAIQLCVNLLSETWRHSMDDDVTLWDFLRAMTEEELHEHLDVAAVVRRLRSRSGIEVA